MLALLAANPSLAADVFKAPPPVPVWSWTGLYAGVNVGGIVGVDQDQQSATFSSTALGINGLLSTSDWHAAPGVAAGGQIGYNWQLPSRWVVGLEADWQLAWQRKSSLSCTPPAAVPFFGAGGNGFGYCLADDNNKLTDFGTARARGGDTSPRFS